MKLIVLAVFLCMVINFDTCLGTADGNTIFKRATQQRILKAGEKLYKRLSPYLLIICGETDEDTGLMYIVDDAHMGYIYQHDELRRFLKNPKKFLPSTRIIYAGMKKDRDFNMLKAYMIYICKEN
ncbi:cytochrome c isoform X2 [Octopus bimaculoides]|uniref:Uncharacterized protein n=1 Tax=Octopus bimaculoides TaxID=37653 RepID=A0A0L8HF76_OCTBM|nr:cytochrome c isoform X2 [Octopus bimaculoides]|eukprot:XP_014772793.1 PREDICTED: cytochrome c-like isoform X2 [Octopus bimaculoides]